MENKVYHRVLKSHSEIATVNIAIKNIYEEHKKLGYQLSPLCLNCFIYNLLDGKIKVYWENGFFYEEIIEIKDISNEGVYLGQQIPKNTEITFVSLKK